MYNAEDLACEMETEASLCKEKDQSRKRKFQQVFESISSIFHTDNNLEDRIVEIIHTLEYLVNQKHLLRLISTSKGVHRNKSSSSSPTITCANNISVIPIVGMGDIGKTTLARLVYNDVKIIKNFDLKAWVIVSDEFEVFKLTKTIFDQIITGKKDCNIKHPDQLQYELKKVIEGKKFLFVFHDVWNKNYNLWDNLKSQFKFEASGSKIIVTTRDQNIGSIMDKSALREYEEFGRGIVRKCNGLPLAIKSLGGLFHCINEWEDILNSDIWKLQCDILPALWLSYHYDLLQPWQGKTLEEIGEEYFNDLTSRSFFHHTEHGCFTMLDLVNDLATFVSREFCL
nr:putative disease resistance RPP13-like protein 1 [Ziziphus jujuba var. spinosa]